MYLAKPNADGTCTTMTLEESLALHDDEGEVLFGDPVALEVMAHYPITCLVKEQRRLLVEHLHKVPWGQRLAHQLRSLKPVDGRVRAPPLEFVDHGYLVYVLGKMRGDLLDALLDAGYVFESSKAIEHVLVRSLPLSSTWFRLLSQTRVSHDLTLHLLDSNRYREAIPYLSSKVVCDVLPFVESSEKLQALRAMGYNPTASNLARGILYGLSEPKFVYNSYGRTRFWMLLGDQLITEELFEIIRLAGLYWVLLGSESEFALAAQDLSEHLLDACLIVIRGGWCGLLLTALTMPEYCRERLPIDILARILLTERHHFDRFRYQVEMLSYEDRSFLIRAAALRNNRQAIEYLSVSF